MKPVVADPAVEVLDEPLPVEPLPVVPVLAGAELELLDVELALPADCPTLPVTAEMVPSAGAVRMVPFRLV
jgi:hypothetical protein